MKNKLILAILIIAGGLAIAACGTRTVVIPSAATPTVTVTPSSAPAPQATTTVPEPQAPAGSAGTTGVPGTGASNYAQDIANAGIVAPPGWLTSTGNRLCSDWSDGQTASQTDQILLDGGIHPNHLATFDSITNSDVCPGVTR
jgi:hypothetical protein